MLNKKCALIIIYIVAILIIAKLLFLLTMVVWGFVGTAPLPVFQDYHDIKLLEVFRLSQEIGTTLFIYAILAVMKNMINHYTKIEVLSRRSGLSVNTPVLTEKQDLDLPTTTKKVATKKATTKKVATKKATTKKATSTRKKTATKKAKK